MKYRLRKNNPNGVWDHRGADDRIVVFSSFEPSRESSAWNVAQVFTVEQVLVTIEAILDSPRKDQRLFGAYVQFLCDV